MSYLQNRQAVKYEEDFVDGQHVYRFTGPCRRCQKPQTVTVKGPDMFRYNNGTLIQDAFPYLNAGQREWCISGTCGPCFEEIFKEDE